jgi:hypothetical protein
MHTADRFLKFAAECKLMAKSTRSTENRAVWNGLAQRWLRCVELLEHRKRACDVMRQRSRKGARGRPPISRSRLET